MTIHRVALAVFVAVFLNGSVALPAEVGEGDIQGGLELLQRLIDDTDQGEVALPLIRIRHVPDLLFRRYPKGEYPATVYQKQ